MDAPVPDRVTVAVNVPRAAPTSPEGAGTSWAAVITVRSWIVAASGLADAPTVTTSVSPSATSATQDLRAFGLKRSSLLELVQRRVSSQRSYANGAGTVFVPRVAPSCALGSEPEDEPQGAIYFGELVPAQRANHFADTCEIGGRDVIDHDACARSFDFDLGSAMSGKRKKRKRIILLTPEERAAQQARTRELMEWIRLIDIELATGKRPPPDLTPVSL
jgi:hypothetical protein